MSDRPILRGMLVTELRGEKFDVTAWGSRYREWVIGDVKATLVGYGIEIERRYSPSDAPRIGDRVEVEL